MAKFVSIDEAVQLTGLSDLQIRTWMRQIKMSDGKKQKKYLKKKNGEWLISLPKLDQLVEQHLPMRTFTHQSSPPPNAAGPGQSSPYADRLIDIMEHQLEEKDRQIHALHQKLDGFLERLREVHVIVNDLQKKLQWFTAGKMTDDPSTDTASQAAPGRALASLPERSFSQWVTAFLDGAKDFNA